ncbi:MAG: translesion DNA synthesis-associated protein ImuA [Gammaproteobacteria bacterium]|nr:translesion DNA synthesis-associated protein ImuA [Gammaproteobacteria bacterium]MDD9894890.1 translesion DNA synthesis-associated protein ImuA [Gammaproteobacteria bacterium]
MKTYSESSTKAPESLLDRAYSHIDGIEQDGLPAPSIEELLQRNADLWRGCDMAGQGVHGQSTGYPQLDEVLPGRGWPQNGLMEIISPHWGMGELQLLIPLMRSVIARGQWILWISPPHLLYAPALTQAGINTDQILVVNLDTSCKDALWSMEKALQTKNCGLVLAWQTWLPGKVLRRLQLAAETGSTLGVLFKHRDSKYSPSRLRIQIKGSSSSSADFSTADVTVIKARGNFRPLTTRLKLYQHHA